MSFVSVKEGDLFDKLRKGLFYLFLGFLGLLIGVFFASRVTRARVEKEESAYLLGKELASFIDKRSGSFESRQKGLEKLMALVKTHPELHSQYDAKIAQELLNQGKGREAEVFADFAILRATNDMLPFYSDFSEITLMTSKGDYREALDKTLILKGKMLQNLAQFKVKKEAKRFGDLLFAFNLLREVFLMQQVGDKALEKRSWEEFLAYAGDKSKTQAVKEGISREAFQKVISLFDTGKETLASYMEERLKTF
jgi:hypothetical protein